MHLVFVCLLFLVILSLLNGLNEYDFWKYDSSLQNSLQIMLDNDITKGCFLNVGYSKEFQNTSSLQAILDSKLTKQVRLDINSSINNKGEFKLKRVYFRLFY